jgi:phosphoribosylaminoimidazole-succinocarboxamide synthase
MPRPNSAPQPLPPHKLWRLQSGSCKQNQGFKSLLSIARVFARAFLSRFLPEFSTARTIDNDPLCAKMLSLRRGESFLPATPASRILRETHFAGLEPSARGKVRDIYDLGDKLLIVATDRLSAFDVILPTPIPDKGRVLTQLSLFWFDLFKDVISNHVLSADQFPAAFDDYRHELAGRSMIVRKTQPLLVECVVRGYLSGSGWKDYLATGMLCGIELPPGLRESDRLPAPIFTPSTKSAAGHDENISFEQVVSLIGEELARQVRAVSIDLYQRAAAYAEPRGVILADTKFEFGLLDGELIWIDEAFTPDSSRFWPAAQYHAGGPQPSFDKQFVRDYLERIRWPKIPPGPELPAGVVAATREKYLEAFRILTGRAL